MESNRQAQDVSTAKFVTRRLAVKTMHLTKTPCITIHSHCESLYMLCFLVNPDNDPTRRSIETSRAILHSHLFKILDNLFYEPLMKTYASLNFVFVEIVLALLR